MNLAAHLSGADVISSGEAAVVHAKLVELVRHLERLDDTPGQRVHMLFAQLYEGDMEHWLERINQADDEGLFGRFSTRFFNGYLETLTHCLANRPLPPNSPWVPYQSITRTARMRDSTWTHLAILSSAARAHIRGDIGPSLAQAARELSEETGRAVNLHAHASFFLDDANRAVIQNAALDMIDQHLAVQSGYRRVLLRAFRWVFPKTGWIWWTVMQRWRRHSWNSAIAQLYG